VSAISSVRLLIKRFKKLPMSKIIVVYLMLVTLLSFYNYSPVPGTKSGDTTPYRIKNADKIHRYLSIIPPDTEVAASNNIGAHLSHRKMIYVVPLGISSANYIVLYKEKEDLRSNINGLLYETIVEDKNLNFYIYKKRVNLSCQNCNP